MPRWTRPVVRLETKLGVGGAVLAGVTDGHRIVVKVDGDGQMDPALIRRFVCPIEEGAADVTKGNRFCDLDSVRSMPLVRLFGNAALSFLTKLSFGYWSIFDPTNGFVAWESRILALSLWRRRRGDSSLRATYCSGWGFCAPRFSTFRWRPPTEVRRAD